MRHLILHPVAVFLLALLLQADAAAQRPGGPLYSPLESQNWNINFQTTYVWQRKPSFDAPYTGPNSLLPTEETGYTLTGTLFVGYRPFEGAEIFFNPEVIQSVDISGLTGLGGESNGENQKSGGPTPKLYAARLFWRQTFHLGPTDSKVDPAQNQFGAQTARRRLVLTAGKIALTDVFDQNAYNHDPRTQFENWAVWTYGASDFAADARGYTIGVALEYYDDEWAFRIGRFCQPKTANGLFLDADLLDHFGDNVEIERGHSLLGWPGKVRVLGFRNVATMGSFRDALELARRRGSTPAVADVRSGRTKWGFGVGLEQAIGRDVGLFARYSFNDGQTETYAYAEIERSLQVGALIKGRLWWRPDDSVGIAYVANGLSDAHRDYLRAGGLGFFIGDGRLAYSEERILEAFYSLRAFKGFWFSLDYQFISNPAYNADRGPVSIFGCRFHYEY